MRPTNIAYNPLNRAEKFSWSFKGLPCNVIGLQISRVLETPFATGLSIEKRQVLRRYHHPSSEPGRPRPIRYLCLAGIILLRFPSLALSTHDDPRFPLSTGTNMPSPQQALKIDLSTQRILISPDDPLPKFNPRPKAVMVIPIYHDSEIAQYPKITSSALAPPTLPPRVASRSPQPKHKRRLGLFRRASSYSPPPSSPTRTERRSRSRHRSLLHRRDHSVPPPAAVPVYTYPQSSVVIPERERKRVARR
ncbi:hypothetical protein NMY22_g9984 [Coprinellus aureogranulatus]|nr:hypothetical protein NMY22_g9984 [Coprinellus aureogranulatus]